ncbi:MAG: hypothetical protein ACM31H_03155 [Nitrososphaerales archaeon]
MDHPYTFKAFTSWRKTAGRLASFDKINYVPMMLSFGKKCQTTSYVGADFMLLKKVDLKML